MYSTPGVFPRILFSTFSVYLLLRPLEGGRVRQLEVQIEVALVLVRGRSWSGSLPPMNRLPRRRKAREQNQQRTRSFGCQHSGHPCT